MIKITEQGTNPQQPLYKNDFLAWNAPVSPVACV
jgi:hypothetical protein